MAPTTKGAGKNGVTGTKKKRGGDTGEFTLKRVKGPSPPPASACQQGLALGWRCSHTDGRWASCAVDGHSQERTSTSTPRARARRSSSTAARQFATGTARSPRPPPSRRARRMLRTDASRLTSAGSVRIQSARVGRWAWRGVPCHHRRASSALLSFRSPAADWQVVHSCPASGLRQHACHLTIGSRPLPDVHEQPREGPVLGPS